MLKTDQLAFLEEQLTIATKAYLVNEPRYRILTSQVMGGKTNLKLSAEQTKAKLVKDMLSGEIRNIKIIIEEIEGDKFDL